MKMIALWKKRMEELHAKRQYSRPPLPDGRDPFQDLPGELWTKIASCLPVEYAARTSALSKQWRDKWKVVAQNRHFDGGATVKFSSSGCPVSQFCCLDGFLSWIEEQVILQIDETLFIKSLGINFFPGDDEYGWIELNRDDFPPVAGYRVVSLKKNPNNNNNNCHHHRRLLIGDVFSRPPWRAYLLQHLTLQHCSMETVKNHLIGGGGGGGGYNCLRWLNSLTLRFVGSMDRRSLSGLISCCPSLRKLELFRCDFVSPKSDGIIEIRWKGQLKELRLMNCTGAFELRMFSGRRPFKVPLLPSAANAAFYYDARKRRFFSCASTNGIQSREHPDGHWPTHFGTPMIQPMPPARAPATEGGRQL